MFTRSHDQAAINADSKPPRTDTGQLLSDAGNSFANTSHGTPQAADSINTDDRVLFEQMAANIGKDSFSIHKKALPDLLAENLWVQSRGGNQHVLNPAGVGRKAGVRLDRTVRSDRIAWIDGSSVTGAGWIKWAAGLQSSLNSSLFLGLFSFESHYALYNPGCFYKSHFDAFHGQRNRILSIIIYLNHDWLPADGGELVLFTDGNAGMPVRVIPEFGTVVAFLSEEIPHEVLATNRDRYSIAGWFCVSGSNPKM